MDEASVWLLAERSAMPPSACWTDTTTRVNSNQSAATPISVAWTIPAWDALPGTLYEIAVPFTVTMESQTLQLGLSVDGSSSFAASDTIGGAIVGAGTGLSGRIRVFLQVLAAGAGGSFSAWVEGVVRQAGVNSLFTNSAVLAGPVAASVPLDTTVSHTIQVSSLWGGSAAGQTVSGFGSRLTRRGR